MREREKDPERERRTRGGERDLEDGSDAEEVSSGLRLPAGGHHVSRGT